jgi:DTW domain-containing protein
MNQETQAHRTMCYECFRPQTHCICSLIQTVNNKTGIFILQHPAERNHPFGTARIATLALTNVKLEIAWPGFARNASLEKSIPMPSGILYPSESAIDLADCTPEQRPKNLVVLDGTWNTARTIYRTYPNLRTLPHYKLTPKVQSGYKIRKAPKAEHRSTIEAIWQALSILEPQNDETVYLVEAFNKMIENQIQFQKTHPGRPRRRAKVKAKRKPLPTAFTNDFKNLIIGYGEFFRDPQTKSPLQIYYWAAHKPSSGETFSMGLRPEPHQKEYFPTGEEIEWTGLKPNTVLQGSSQNEFRDAWRNFAGDDYILGTWNETTRRLFEEICPPMQPGLQLKSIYYNVGGSPRDPVPEITDYENIEASLLSVGGRAQHRLSQGVAVSLWLQQVALKRNESSDPH